VTRLAVDLEALAELVDGMQRFQDHLTATRQEVERRVAAMQLTWSGAAAAEQAAAQRHWSRATDELQQALAALRSIGLTAHANYAAAMAANRRMWSL
jgi:WXG100 family type VII secretion target